MPFLYGNHVVKAHLGKVRSLVPSLPLSLAHFGLVLSLRSRKIPLSTKES